jgi:hypothetical protein
MLSQCANPSCCTPLRYLRDGRLFQFEVKAASVSNPSEEKPAPARKCKARRIWHYWLCGSCAPNVTLAFDRIKGLEVVPLQSVYAHVGA